MKERIVYLDSSAVVKRYISEPGSDYVKSLYLSSCTGNVIGEVLGVFDKARMRGLIMDDGYRIIKLRLLRETLRLIRLKILIPLKQTILRNVWKNN